MTAKFIKYCQPLIQGEVEVPYDNGLPAYMRFPKENPQGAGFLFFE